MIVYILSIVTLLLPSYSIWRLFKTQYKSKNDWLLIASQSTFIVLFSYFAGVWGYLSYYLKYLALILLIYALCSSYFKIKVKPNFSNERTSTSLSLFFLFVLILINVLTIKGMINWLTPLNIAFPLKKGHYYVLQGGNSPITNVVHQRNPEYKYALDIVKLNKFGNRAYGLYPKSLDRYTIYHDIIYSPSDGQIINVVNDLPDNIPPNVDLINTVGNHVIIRNRDYDILIAHMIPGSILIKLGDSIKKGQEIGMVGNSGFSIEPHLHISAVKYIGSDKIAVPITFDGKFYSLNSVIVER